MISPQQDVMEAISNLSQCNTENEAHTLTQKIIHSLGAESFVYTTLLPPHFHSLNESYRFFIGCSSELCKIYSSRMWVMNDPFIEYARSNSAPIIGSKIKLSTQGQTEMLKVCAQHGFASGLVVPTHTSMDANKRMGVLYVGSDLSAEIGEAMLLKKRVQFVALGSELLSWWNSRLKQQAMRKYSLIEEEVELLMLSKNGRVASEIAAIFDIKVAAAYQRLNAIKEKFNVDKIGHAIVEAEAVGLFG
jgi:DNA-binding CsgD family transcriptional regulator